MDRPTGSVTGQDEWEWNREFETNQGGTAARDRGGGPDNTRPDGEAVGLARWERRDLKAELERKDRRFRTVVEQYERRLAEKNRKLSERPGPSRDSEGLLGWLRSFLR